MKNLPILPIRLLAYLSCVAVLTTSSVAAAQACVTCWNASCPEMRSYVSACAAKPKHEPRHSASGGAEAARSRDPHWPTASDSADALEKSCAHGHAASCTRLGRLYALGKQAERDDTKAAEAYRRGCAGGDAKGCTWLGDAYRDGRGVERDHTQAVQYLRQACDASDGEGCTDLGGMYRASIDAPPEPDAAARLFKRGCDLEEPSGCLALARSQAAALSQPEAQALTERAFKLATRGCARNNLFHCSLLAALHDSDGPHKDVKQAFTLNQQLCKQGYGCAHLAEAYWNGAGVEQDRARARELLEEDCAAGGTLGCTDLGELRLEEDPDAARKAFDRACDQGAGYACFQLGLMYTGRRGVSADPVKSFGFFREGCWGGNASSCDWVAQSYFHGTGVAKDPDQGLKYAKMACDRSPSDCAMLGMAYRDALGVAKNVPRAIELFDSACVAKNGDGCLSEALIYQSGDGVPQDAAKAAQLKEKACQLGIKAACKAGL